MNADKCACCGVIIPEGTQVCITCLNGCAECGWEDKDNCKACRMRNKLKRREIKLMAETDLNHVRDIEKELYTYQNTGLTVEEITSLKEKFDQSTAETQRLLEKLTELKDSCYYWEREAKKWCDKLFEIRSLVERSKL